jgi:hypothetical protein
LSGRETDACGGGGVATGAAGAGTTFSNSLMLSLVDKLIRTLVPARRPPGPQ